MEHTKSSLPEKLALVPRLIKFPGSFEVFASGAVCGKHLGSVSSDRQFEFAS